ncbi:hypothetical protein JKF63_05217 [Porcisia hertigi]|uniref:Las1-like protein n=1 Tax=Porcisia hertigi TaxID=2761500 RepID=A0A836IFW7_9TRYP|nr:hypothetical protein JKF63_05217 [Porcisia hertigi]
MRRSHVDEGRRRQALAERRFRGHRIRGGLEDLGDLDAPKTRKERKDCAGAVTGAVTEAAAKALAEKVETETGVCRSTEGTIAAANIATPEIFSTVFGADWCEWMEVKRVLFDMTATTAAKRSALEIIHVWRQRTRKERELPAYVESTEVLMDAILQDENDALQDVPLRMCYGAAILRTVHVMTGSFATGFADTYRKRASEIGFPEEAVEVRQRVAHGVLPLVSELRWVCGLVLQFLFLHYWLEQERQVYLMQQERGTSLSVGSALTAAQHRKSGGASDTAPSAGTSALAVAASPPSVTTDEIRALLHELESSEDEDGGVVGKKEKSTERDDKAASITPSVCDAVQKHESPAAMGTSSGATITKIAGWCVS